MIKGKEQLSDIFSIFHDGSIAGFRFDLNELELVVEIDYLAQRIDPDFKKFFLVIRNVKDLSLAAWSKDPGVASVSIVSPSEIFEGEPEILSGDVKGDFVEVVLNEGPQYSGGILKFKAEAASVFDEKRKEYSFEELAEICKGYWDDWKRRNES